MAQPAFRRGTVDTAFIDRQGGSLVRPAPAPEAALAAATLSRIVGNRPKAGVDRFSPWRLRDGWRSAGEDQIDCVFDDCGTQRRVRLRFGADGIQLDFGRRRVPALGWALGGGDLGIEFGGRHIEASVACDERGVHVALADGTWRLNTIETASRRSDAKATAGRVVAPMSGKIAAVHVAKGATVTRGQILLVLEAMKMEHAIAAPGDGIIAEIRCVIGDPVAEGAELVVLSAGKERP